VSFCRLFEIVIIVLLDFHLYPHEVFKHSLLKEYEPHELLVIDC